MKTILSKVRVMARACATMSVATWALLPPAAQAQAGSDVRLHMEPAAAADTMQLRAALGSEFVRGKGAFAAELKVARVDANGDGTLDLVALQKGFCSNASCTFELLLSQGGALRPVASLDSWGVPYVSGLYRNGMYDLIGFEHLSDDCNACSEPQPVRYGWSAIVRNGRKVYGYRSLGAVRARPRAYRPSFQ